VTRDMASANAGVSCKDISDELALDALSGNAGVYVYRDDQPPRFHRVKAPDKNELEALVQRISKRVGRLSLLKTSYMLILLTLEALDR